MRHERFAAGTGPAQCGDNALMAGSAVLTLDGALPVDHLAPGDRVITRDAGSQPLRAVRVTQRTTPIVRLCGGTLGPQAPRHDTLLPARAALLLRGDHALALTGRPVALIPAHQLVDGIRVTHAGVQDLPLFELVFDAPHILYAAGLELASAPPLSAPTCAAPAAAPRAGPRQ